MKRGEAIYMPHIRTLLSGELSARNSPTPLWGPHNSSIQLKLCYPTAQSSLPMGLTKATGAAHRRAVLAQEGGFLLSQLARKVPSSEGKKSGEERARQPGDPRLKRLSNMSDWGQITPPAHASWASFPLLTWDSSRELSAGWSAASDGFRWLWACIYVLSHWETLSLTVVII